MFGFFRTTRTALAAVLAAAALLPATTVRAVYCNNDPVNCVDPLGLVLVAFDGTNNIKENPGTNVWLFKNAYAGVAKPIYYPGVGTVPKLDSFTGHTTVLGSAFGKGVWARIGQAKKDLEEYFIAHPDDRDVDIIGFSRGAATARGFANEITPLLGKYGARIRFIGVWDTVDAMGTDIEQAIRGNDTGGLNMAAPPGVSASQILHAMAAQENRSRYYVVRFAPGTATEEWFLGVHSNAGNGYPKMPGLGNISLRRMLEFAVGLGVPLKDWAKTPERRWEQYPTTPENTAFGNELVFPKLMWFINNRQYRNLDGATFDPSVVFREYTVEMRPSWLRFWETQTYKFILPAYEVNYDAFRIKP